MSYRRGLRLQAFASAVPSNQRMQETQGYLCLVCHFVRGKSVRSWMILPSRSAPASSEALKASAFMCNQTGAYTLCRSATTVPSHTRIW